MEELWNLIKRAAREDPDGEPRGLAVGVVRRVGKAALVDLVAREIEHAQRALHAQAEAAAFRGHLYGAAVASVPTSAEVAAETDSDPFRALFDIGFKLGDGSEPVKWGLATVEQHEQRIVMLVKIRDGLDSTIARHREAIARIEAAGVTCLAEIGGVESDAA